MADEKEIPSDESAGAENTNSSQTSRNKKSSGLISTILLVVFFVALVIWIRFSPAAPSEITPAAPPEMKADESPKENLRDSQINDALDNFLATNYAGWQQQGKSFDDDLSDEDRLQIFDVQLSNGNKNQIIKVFVEKFQKDDDSGEYWFAYQPNNQQMIDMQNKVAKKSPADNSPEKDNSNAR